VIGRTARSPVPAGLLVSVRSKAEAGEALAGGAAIIDVKEPLRGPLGRADVEVAVAIGCVVGQRGCLTVACGELAAGGEEIAAHVSAVVAGLAVAEAAAVTAVKAGPAGLSLDRWRRAYDRLGRRLAGHGVDLVAVAYADASAAAAPAPLELIAAAADAGAATILIDTFAKAGAGLLLEAGRPPVREWLAAAHERGLPVALAGRLTAAEVAVAAVLGADVVGVRSAACGGDRLGSVARGHVAAIVGTLSAGVPADGRRWGAAPPTPRGVSP